MMTKIGELSGSTKRLVLILATALAATASTFAQQEEEEEATPAEKQALKELTHIQPVAASLEQIMQKLAAIEKEVQESQLKQAQVKKESKKQDLAQTNQHIQKKEQQKIGASEPELQQIEVELQVCPLELQKIKIEEELQVLEKEVEELEVQLPPPPPPIEVPPISPPTTPGPLGTLDMTDATEFSYNASEDRLTIPSSASKYSTSQDLQNTDITEDNLIGMEVDETTAMTIPILPRDILVILNRSNKRQEWLLQCSPCRTSLK